MVQPCVPHSASKLENIRSSGAKNQQQTAKYPKSVQCWTDMWAPVPETDRNTAPLTESSCVTTESFTQATLWGSLRSRGLVSRIPGKSQTECLTEIISHNFFQQTRQQVWKHRGRSPRWFLWLMKLLKTWLFFITVAVHHVEENQMFSRQKQDLF